MRCYPDIVLTVNPSALQCVLKNLAITLSFEASILLYFIYNPANLQQILCDNKQTAQKDRSVFKTQLTLGTIGDVRKCKIDVSKSVEFPHLKCRPVLVQRHNEFVRIPTSSRQHQ